jgi:methylated-DNA-[protein]-cysteine S-methyltransferase
MVVQGADADKQILHVGCAMATRGVTDFEKKVYAAVRLIPRGRVTTYRALAGYLGCRCYRAVGQALRRNPFAPAVPCHRVIASSLGPGGFRGSRGVRSRRAKLRLLAGEGVFFRAGRLADVRRLFLFGG